MSVPKRNQGPQPWVPSLVQQSPRAGQDSASHAVNFLQWHRSKQTKTNKKQTDQTNFNNILHSAHIVKIFPHVINKHVHGLPNPAGFSYQVSETQWVSRLRHVPAPGGAFLALHGDRWPRHGAGVQPLTAAGRGT